VQTRRSPAARGSGRAHRAPIQDEPTATPVAVEPAVACEASADFRDREQRVFDDRNGAERNADNHQDGYDPPEPHSFGLLLIHCILPRIFDYSEG